MLYDTYHYSTWDDTQNIFELDAEEMMDRLSDELSRHGDIWRALREMTRRGMQDPSGRPMPSIDQLMQQTQAQRNRQLPGVGPRLLTTAALESSRTGSVSAM